MFGTLLIAGPRGLIPQCLTLENPWVENQPNVSAIPAGSYQCELIDSPSKGKVYTVRNVPGRTNILIHGGNTEVDTHGCILLGSGFGVLGGVPAIMASQLALSGFMAKMAGFPRFNLAIEDQWRWYNGPLQ